METVTVRQVKKEDLDACFAIESACYTYEGATREKIAKRIELYARGFLVVEGKGKVVAMVNCGATNKEDITDEAFKDMTGHEEKGKNMVIFSLAVLPSFQGRGFTKPLMKALFQVCREESKENLLLICKEEHIDYYKKFGFLLRGKSLSEHGGFEWFEMALSF